MSCPYCGYGSFLLENDVDMRGTDCGFDLYTSCVCRKCDEQFILRRSYIELEECDAMTVEEYEESE